MADNIIRKKDGDEFMDCLQNREFDLIEKMVNSILNAIAKNKKKVDIFNVILSDGDEFIFTMHKPNYKECLENCIRDFEKQELYEKCVEIKNTIKLL
jgi:hypothetical protein